MGIIIDDGWRREPVSNQFGEEIGVAEYNLNDVRIRERIITFASELREKAKQYKSETEELEKDKSVDEDGMPNSALPLVRAEVRIVDEMITMIDEILGNGFCKKAIGDNKNPRALVEIVGAVAEEYLREGKEEMDKYMNRQQRRAGERAKAKEKIVSILASDSDEE